MPPAHSPTSAREVQAQRFIPALQAQRWSLESPRGGSLSRAIHLSAGKGLLAHEGGEIPLRGGDIVWLPAGQARWLRVEAGSAGISVGVSDSLLAAAMGERPDAAPLRQVSSRLVQLSAPAADLRDELVRSLHAIEAEASGGVANPGASRAFHTAHLTLVLVMLWRMTSQGSPAEAEPAPKATQRLMRFRHLVEAQFRSRWTVTRYAAELAVSPDRLHDICVRALGRRPIELIHQRLVREACSLLAGTDLALERLAGELGFASASQFSHFFKRQTGTTPRTWRTQVREQAAAGTRVGPASYADWP